MKRVLKYPLEITDEQVISLPNNSDFLTVQVQRQTPCLWVAGDTDAPLVDLTISMRGTGQPFTGKEGKFIATFQWDEGTYIFHVFGGAV